jgi:t-SNARE complex subunit (syntaxin)
MQGIYDYIRETNHVSIVCIVAGIIIIIVVVVVVLLLLTELN